MKQITGGITAPKGYTASGTACGIKKKNLDLTLIASTSPAQAAGAFTTNRVSAAPVHWDRRIIREQGAVRAIVVNSGNANACTGAQGAEDTRSMAELTAEALQISADEVLVCSTGVIGVPLPMDKLAPGIRKAASVLDDSPDSARRAAEGILTTDTTVKEIVLETDVEGVPVRIAGIAKGSGMIHPDMATMLAFTVTDAALEPGLLQKLLNESLEDSYHMISVDGDTSTNDTVLALANGASGAPVISESSPGYTAFAEAFRAVHTCLAKEIVRDGEGATKFLEARAAGAATKGDARKLVKSVITSSLVKTALFGEDANWGRILCAMGYSGGYFSQDTADLHITSSSGSILLLQQGTPVAFDEDEAKNVLSPRDITIEITLRDGDSCAAAWGCDLSYEYVRINGAYRT